jgi:hypothetical protein
MGPTSVEYQAMPSLHDVAHGGWLCTFIIKQHLDIPSARSWVAPVRATGTVQKRQAVRPVRHVQNHTCRITILQPARLAAVLGQPSSLRPHLIVRAMYACYLPVCRVLKPNT